jgi:hypothetical protein
VTCKGVILAEGVYSRRRDTRSIASGLVRARKTWKYSRTGISMVSNSHLRTAGERKRKNAKNHLKNIKFSDKRTVNEAWKVWNEWMYYECMDYEWVNV